MKLFYYPICPISNKFRILLKFLKLDIDFIKIISRQDVNKLPKDLHENIKYLPLLEDSGKYYRDNTSILLHLIKLSQDKILTDWLNNEAIQYMEVFFDKYMFFDVYKNAIFEKTQKLVLYNEYFPNTDVIKTGTLMIDEYLCHLDKILSKQDWLQNNYSLNDISGFGMLAALDYCCLVPWNKYPKIKSWYRRMKSQEDYNFILKDRIYNFLPHQYYEKIDF